MEQWIYWLGETVEAIMEAILDSSSVSLILDFVSERRAAVWIAGDIVKNPLRLSNSQPRFVAAVRLDYGEIHIKKKEWNNIQKAMKTYFQYKSVRGDRWNS